jgi:uncharacterized protein (DUF952 family)
MTEGLVYKIMTAADWRAVRDQGSYEGSVHDRRDGFIHFSTARQVAGTAAKHFAGQPDLVLLGVDASMLGEALKWEPSRGGDLFPHLYRPMPASAVVTAHDLPLDGDGRHRLPAVVG